MQLELEVELRRIAKENKLSEEVVSHIFNYQFKFLQTSIKTDNTKTVMLPRFGKFCLSAGKLKKINEHNAKKGL